MEQETSKSSLSPHVQLMIKVGLILFLTLILQIPLFWVGSLIDERAGLQQSVEAEIASSWGRQQIVRGPVLCVPYRYRELTAEKKPYFTDHLRFLAPEDLKIKGQAATEERERGIFKTVVYVTEQTLEGGFDLSLLPREPAIEYQWEKAAIITGITDPTAISQKITTTWNEIEQKTLPGTGYEGFAGNGFHVPVALQADMKTARFAQHFKVRGSTSLQYLPSGKNSEIVLQSNWPSPSFVGRNLPQERQVGAEGFTANWSANEYNRPFADTWIDQEWKSNNGEEGVFGVKLIQPADFYQKNMRSAKYGALVIILSFVVFFFFEMMLKVRIHPIQYLLVGLSLAIFYLLLLSFTEHLGFNQAYLISAFSVIGLVAVYANAILPGKKQVALLSLLFVALYAYIFVLLQLEDFALLAGAVGLFVILATVMMLSRKINWYKIGGGV